MIEQVVVPVDFSRESDRAILTATALASWAHVDVELITVVDPLRRSETAARLDEAARRAGEGTSWRMIESLDSTGAVLLAELRASEKDLWCVGTHARGAFGELLLGSLSETLVREADLPVVLIGPHVSARPTGNVLAVALDGTARSESVLPATAELALDLGMSLRLLQVQFPSSEPMPADVFESNYLSRTAARLPSLDVVDFDVLHGHHPAEDLATYAAEHREVGLVALATRALGGAARLRRGGTAFELAHRAPVPVLAVHQG